MASPYQHRPVLLEQSVELLNLQPHALVVDGTLGGGGHAEAILERTAPDGILVGLDLDDEALEHCEQRLRPYAGRVRTARASFRRLRDVLDGMGLGQVDGVLLDLGVSSRFLDDPERGFRFREESAERTPLDMRMDRRQRLTAADLLQSASAAEIEGWLRDYGELPGAARLARTLVEERKQAPLLTAADLLRVIQKARVGGHRRHHPATLVFQALRIAVNDELGALSEGLEIATSALRPGGRLVVIAYHSLEDRIVKNHFRDAQRGCTCPPKLPICACGKHPTLQVITRRAVKADEDELRANPRARSARLRAAARLAVAA